jgi:integrase
MTEVAEGKWFGQQAGQDITFGVLMDKYMSEHSRPNKASSDRDERSLKHLKPVFEDILISEITPRMINEYKTSRRKEGASPCSINRELALMKHAFTLAMQEWECIAENPVKRVSMEKEPPARDRWLDDEEEKNLLEKSPEWLKRYIIFALDTGCRKNEIRFLTWENVSSHNTVVNIFGTKTGERRSIPLTQRVCSMLQAMQKGKKIRSIKKDFVFTHPEGQQVNLHTLRSAFERACENAGIDNFRFHDLRHTFASRLAQKGVDPYTIQRLMGHKSFSTTQRYAHHYTESLRRGIAVLETPETTISTKLAQ